MIKGFARILATTTSTTISAALSGICLIAKLAVWNSTFASHWLCSACSACRNRLRVDIHSYHVSRTQFECGNGQYARTTAIIQDIFAPLQILVKPGEAQLSGRMTARAES